MCARAGLDYSWAQLWETFALSGTAPEGGIRVLNLSPSWRGKEGVHWNRVPVVCKGESGRKPVGMIWPLIPAWLKGELPTFSTANCRSEAGRPFSEVVASKPAFRRAWQKGQRCLVPFSWFYEWDQHSRPKQPWRVLPTGSPFLVMAGLWEAGRFPDGQAMASFTLVTTGPNALMTNIGHHRTPVVLDPADWDCWLTGSSESAESLIKPPPASFMQAHKVTTRVNNPTYQGEDLLSSDLGSTEAH
ncbi:MAG: SOS response-associated peptidase [Wenzhouxiangella sp.]